MDSWYNPNSIITHTHSGHFGVIHGSNKKSYIYRLVIALEPLLVATSTCFVSSYYIIGNNSKAYSGEKDRVVHMEVALAMPFV